MTHKTRKPRIKLEDVATICKEIMKKPSNIDAIMYFWVSRARLLAPIYEPMFRTLAALYENDSSVGTTQQTILVELSTGVLNLYHAMFLHEYFKPDYWDTVLKIADTCVTFSGEGARDEFRNFCIKTRDENPTWSIRFQQSPSASESDTIPPSPESMPELSKQDTAPQNRTLSAVLSRLLRNKQMFDNELSNYSTKYYEHSITNHKKPSIESFIEYMIDNLPTKENNV